MAIAALPKAKSFQVTGDGRGSQEFRRRPLGDQLPGSRSRLPMAETPTPEWPMPWGPSPVT